MSQSPKPGRVKRTVKNGAHPALRLEYRTADELSNHPENWRQHPATQLRVLRDTMAEVGWAGAVLFNERTGVLIDGHARKALARKGEQIPVLIGSWSPEEERKILLTLDPIGQLSEVDGPALSALLERVTAQVPADDSTAVSAFMASLQPAPMLELGSPPESVQDNAHVMESIRQRRQQGNAATQSANDTERYLILVFPTRAAKNDRLRALGLPEDERYLPGDGYEIRARGPVKKYRNAVSAAPPSKSGAAG